ncbi:hypothetical protein PQX77_003821 [Marasmius sp. AFHP31]|nr:hypothetical protein PQX77_003821 [Marasmius sp. AFHP31]
MLLRAPPSASVILFDFLAPSLCRIAGASSTFSTSSSLHTRPQSRPHSRNRINYVNAPRRLNSDRDVDPKAFAHLNETIIEKYPLGDRKVPEPEKKADIFNSILHRLHQSLRAKDAEGVLRHWHEFAENDLIPLLSSYQLRQISQLTSTDLIPPSSSEQTRLLDGVEDIAVVTAASQFPDALVAAMVFHIKRDDPSAVIRLYDRCKTLMIEKGVWESELTQQENEEDAFSEDVASVEDRPFRGLRIFFPARVKVLLAATTAHAMRDDFQGALNTCLQTDIRFQYNTNTEFLALLGRDFPLREKVMTYIRKLDLAKHLSYPPAFNNHISKLGGGGPGAKQLQRIYTQVVEGISGPEPFIAEHPQSTTSTKPVCITPEGFASFLKAFYQCGRKDLASELWETLPTLGIKHDVTMWTALIDACAQARDFQDAIGTWDMMASKGVQPTALTYRAIIHACFNGQRPRLAMERFHTFESQCGKQGFAPNEILAVCNAVIQGLLHNSREDEAHTLLKSMSKHGVAPDVASYNTFLGLYARRSDLRGITDIMDRMSAGGVQGDVFTYSTILSALLKAGRSDALELVLGIMEGQGIQPSTETYTAIIEHQMKQGNKENVEGALHMLRKMESNPQIHPTGETYITFLRGLHRGNLFTPTKVDQITRLVLKRMEQRDVKLESWGYTALIGVWLDGEHPSGALRAVQVYGEMARRVPILFHTWYVLLSGLIRKGEWKQAEYVVEDMIGRIGEPQGPMNYLVDQVRRRTRAKRIRGI